MNKLVGVMLAVVVGLSAWGMSATSANAEIEDAAAALAVEKACQDKVDAIFASSPTWLTNTEFAKQYNFDKFVAENLGSIDCSIVFFKRLLADKIPGQDWAQRIADYEAYGTYYKELHGWFNTVGIRCFQLVVGGSQGGGIHCMIRGGTQEGVWIGLGWITPYPMV